MHLSPGVYYIAVDTESEGQYTLGMECSNNAGVLIADDYNEYVKDMHSKHGISYLHVIAILLTVVTLPLIGSCLFYTFWNKKLRKVAKDVVYTQSAQHGVINDIEDDVEVEKNEDHTQLTAIVNDEQELY
eukprot:UN01471